MAGYSGYPGYPGYSPPYNYPARSTTVQGSGNNIPLIGPHANVTYPSKAPTRLSTSVNPPTTSSTVNKPASSNTDSVVPLIGPQAPAVPPQVKMPVSELMELTMRMGLDVKFESSLTGPLYTREFVVTCTAGDVVGQGKENNKKKAKHAAAADTLKKLKDSDGYKNHLFNRSSKAALSSHNNTVGRLQEAIAKKGLQNPEYSFEPPTGPPHQRNFSSQVHVGSLVAAGIGRSKKEAKRTAAAAMLDNIKCSNLSLHVPAKKIAFKPASSAIDPAPVLFTKGGLL